MRKTRETVNELVKHFYYIIYYIPETKVRDVVNDNDMGNKNTCCLVREKVIALKRPDVAEMVNYCLACLMLSLARLSGNVQPRWHSQHTVAISRPACWQILNSPWCAVCHRIRLEGKYSLESTDPHESEI